MAYIQATIDEAVNWLIGSFNGKRIAFPDGRYYNECTAPIVRYMMRLNAPVPPMYNARADGWGIRFPAELAPYFMCEAFVPGKIYKRGTILLWNSPHIAVVNYHNGSNLVQVFQQNADPNGSECMVTDRVITNAYHQATYALIPIIQAPTPIIPPKPLPYSYTTKDPFSVWTKQATTLWNLIDMSPIGQVPAYFEVKAVAVAVHTNGKYYYMYDTNSPAGYWADDMSTTNTTPVITIDPIPVPDVPKPQTVADYVPVGLPSSYSEYTLSTTVKYYATAQMAVHDIKPVSTINRGKYLLYRSQDGMDCIVKDKGGIQYWINPADNVKEQSTFDEPLPAPTPLPLPVQPEPAKLPEIVIQPETTEPAQPQPDDLVVNGPNVWKSQTEYLFDDGLPITLQSTNSIPVKIKALDGKLPNTIDLPAHRKLDIIKRFPYNGVWYYQDTMLSDAGRFYALPSAMFPDPYETDQKLATLDINRDGDVNFSDFVDYGSRKFKSGVAVLNSVAKIVANKNVQAVRKSIDGIRKKDRTK